MFYLMMLALITWLRWYLPCLTTVNLLFTFPFVFNNIVWRESSKLSQNSVPQEIIIHSISIHWWFFFGISYYYEDWQIVSQLFLRAYILVSRSFGNFSALNLIFNKLLDNISGFHKILLHLWDFPIIWGQFTLFAVIMFF